MIKVEHLTKCYGELVAVNDLSFELDEGHVYGFLGPNGAGKSTTMNIMTGCLAPTEGSVTIDGHDILEEPETAKRLIGYLPEQPPLYMSETPLEYLAFVGEAKGLRGADRANRGRGGAHGDRQRENPHHLHALQGLPPARGHRAGAHRLPARHHPR